MPTPIEISKRFEELSRKRRMGSVLEAAGYAGCLALIWLFWAFLWAVTP